MNKYPTSLEIKNALEKHYLLSAIRDQIKAISQQNKRIGFEGVDDEIMTLISFQERLGINLDKPQA